MVLLFLYKRHDRRYLNRLTLYPTQSPYELDMDVTLSGEKEVGLQGKLIVEMILLWVYIIIVWPQKKQYHPKTEKI